MNSATGPGLMFHSNVNVDPGLLDSEIGVSGHEPHMAGRGVSVDLSQSVDERLMKALGADAMIAGAILANSF